MDGVDPAECDGAAASAEAVDFAKGHDEVREELASAADEREIEADLTASGILRGARRRGAMTKGRGMSS